MAVASHQKSEYFCSLSKKTGNQRPRGTRGDKALATAQRSCRLLHGTRLDPRLRRRRWLVAARVQKARVPMSRVFDGERRKARQQISRETRRAMACCAQSLQLQWHSNDQIV